MSILVFVEGAEGSLKKSSKEALTYATETGKLIGDTEIIAVVLGAYAETEVSSLGKNGASKVIQVKDDRLNNNQIGAFSIRLNFSMVMLPIPMNSATCSEGFRPPVPKITGHLFRDRSAI